MLSVQELRRIATSMKADDFERQLGPFVLVQRPPDELTAQRALQLGAKRTMVVKPHVPSADKLSLLFELEDLLVATLPPMHDSESATVGRLPDCELVIDDPSVSKHHARLQWNDAKLTATLEDLKSSNGTSVNGVNVTAPLNMSDGDEITFGEARFCYLRTKTLYTKLTTGKFRS